MPILLKTGYTKTIDYTEHPDYKGNEAYFEELLGFQPGDLNAF